ncbi:hypothetical protein [Mycolicibacterium iranicum]|uniref:GGDEF domain-containing protein n=1 Tax=Mycolicibacterium iranicum TaxID=912594 RepID=A0A178LVE5_MYCIR|nr:hypothetical protein [Mycolicibacterium iranicum]OAN37261.1 hypothetical protein A4X20_23110 [Mycolicibacterium iranicum]
MPHAGFVPLRSNVKLSSQLASLQAVVDDNALVEVQSPAQCDLDRLLTSADNAMYTAKPASRNALCHARARDVAAA